MVCASRGWEFESYEEKERYITEFSLEGDPRPISLRTGRRYFRQLPAWYIRPCKCERKDGFLSLVYKFLGVSALRAFLKRFAIYPRPLLGTTRGTIERQRALISTIPVTTAYEVGHTTVGSIHLVAAFAISGPNLGYNGNDKVRWFLSWPLLVANLVVICVIHVLPILLQRMNRAQLYDAIQCNEANGVGWSSAVSKAKLM